MRIIFLVLLLVVGSVKAQKAPKKALLSNLVELNETAIKASGGALGCGSMMIEVNGKLKHLGSSLSFLVPEGRPNLDQLHAICYATYASQFLKDSSWGVPNSSLCYSACEILGVAYNDKSTEYLGLLLATNSSRHALRALKKIGDTDLKQKRKITSLVSDVLLPDEGRPGGWLEKAMRQPLLIEILANDKIRVGGKGCSLDGLKSKMESHMKKHKDDYVVVKYDEKASDEMGNQVNRFLHSIGVSTVDAGDY